MIRLANTSQAGWATVEEYENELLGSDPEDCRKMRQAELKAVKKQNENQSKRFGITRQYSQQFSPQFWNANFGHSYSPTDRSFNEKTNGRFKHTPSIYSERQGSNDHCLACGEQGHSRSKCPWRQTSHYRR